MSTLPSVYDGSIAMQLQPELLGDESLLWSGQPLQKVIFHRRDFFAIPFSLLWGGFAIFWEWGVTGHFSKPAPYFFTLWGIPFVLMGQYMIWGRFFYIAWRKGRTFYGVTNKRVLVLSTGWSRKVTDGYLRSLTSVSITTRSDGIGTIEFAPEPDTQTGWSSWSRSSRNNQLDIDLTRLTFFDIADARSIYQLIQGLREKLGGR
jgi:hypothetical protein